MNGISVLRALEGCARYSLRNVSLVVSVLGVLWMIGSARTGRCQTPAPQVATAFYYRLGLTFVGTIEGDSLPVFTKVRWENESEAAATSGSACVYLNHLAYPMSNLTSATVASLGVPVCSIRYKYAEKEGYTDPIPYAVLREEVAADRMFRIASFTFEGTTRRPYSHLKYSQLRFFELIEGDNVSDPWNGHTWRWAEKDITPLKRVWEPPSKKYVAKDKTPVGIGLRAKVEVCLPLKYSTMLRAFGKPESVSPPLIPAKKERMFWPN